MAINLAEMTELGLDHIYMVPRRGESPENYIKRVGMKTAMKYGPQLVANYTNSGAMGYGAGAGLAGLSTLLAGGSGEEALKSAGMSLAKGYGTKLASQGLATAIGGTASSYVPYIGSAIGIGQALLGKGTEQQKVRSAMQGVGMAVSPWTAGIFAIEELNKNIQRNRSKHQKAQIVFDPTTGEMKAVLGNKVKEGIRKGLAALSPETKSKLGQTIKGESARKMQAFEEYTAGMSPEEKEAMKNTMGDWFTTSVTFDEDDLNYINTPEWTGELGKDRLYTPGMYEVGFEPEQVLNLAKGLSQKGLTLKDYSEEYKMAFDPTDDSGADDKGFTTNFLKKYGNLEGAPQHIKDQAAAFGTTHRAWKGSDTVGAASGVTRPTNIYDTEPTFSPTRSTALVGSHDSATAPSQPSSDSQDYTPIPERSSDIVGARLPDRR